jgi:hypothetical protein
LRKLLVGPPQREAQRLSREALGEGFGNNAQLEQIAIPSNRAL